MIGFSLNLFTLAIRGGFGFAKGSTMALDFTSGNNTLDPRITFSRTTNATLTNSSGLIANAPMNLLTHSEQFDNAAWVGEVGGAGTTPVRTANAAMAPNGTVTADRLQFGLGSGTTTAAFSYIRQSVIPLNTACTGSVYVKLNSGTATLYFRLGNTEVTFAVTSDWTRIDLTCPATNTGNQFGIGLRGGQASPCTDTADVFIWGAQLELGSTATTYNPTTVKNLLGFTEHFDNAAWTKSNAFVQTNLLLWSEYLAATGWTRGTGATFTDSQPDPNGGNNAVLASGLNTISIVPTAASVYNASTTVSASTTYTASVYAKLQSGDGTAFVIRVRTASGTQFFSTQAINSSGWVRVTVTFTVPISDTSLQVVFGSTGASVSAFLYGAQLVQGTTPGDYKATYAAAAAVGYTDIYGQPFAQKLVEDTANAQHRIFGSGAAVAGGIYTFSVYVKAAGRSFFSLYPQSGTAASALYNLENETSTNGSVTANLISHAIQAVGGDWFLCSLTFTTTGATILPHIYLRNSAGAATAPSYTGDGTSGVYIFGAQLSDSASVDPYVYQPVAAPTSTAYYGPRFDYDSVTLAPKGLLIEEQRTNLLLRSEEFDNASWAKINSTVTANAAVAPDGAITADKYIPVNTGSSDLRQNITFASSVYTASIFVNLGDFARGGLSFSLAGTAGGSGVINIQTGSVISSGANFISGGSQPVGNGWYRVYATINNTFVGASTLRFTLTDTSGNLIPGDGTSGIYIWGAQLE